MKKITHDRDGNVLLERVEQLRALRSPQRLQLAAALRALGECSVRELAEHMGRSPESLHYHVKALVAAGLVTRVGKRRITRRMETVYRLAGRDLKIDQGNRTRAYLAAQAELHGGAMRMAGRCLADSLLDQVGRPERQADTIGMWQVSVRLRKREARRLMDRIHAFVQDAVEASGDDQGRLHQLTIAYCPDTKALE